MRKGGFVAVALIGFDVRVSRSGIYSCIYLFRRQQVIRFVHFEYSLRVAELCGVHSLLIDAEICEQSIFIANACKLIHFHVARLMPSI